MLVSRSCGVVRVCKMREKSGWGEKKKGHEGCVEKRKRECVCAEFRTHEIQGKVKWDPLSKYGQLPEMTRNKRPNKYETQKDTSTPTNRTNHTSTEEPEKHRTTKRHRQAVIIRESHGFGS